MVLLTSGASKQIVQLPTVIQCCVRHQEVRHDVNNGQRCQTRRQSSSRNVNRDSDVMWECLSTGSDDVFVTSTTSDILAPTNQSSCGLVKMADRWQRSVATPSCNEDILSLCVRCHQKQLDNSSQREQHKDRKPYIELRQRFQQIRHNITAQRGGCRLLDARSRGTRGMDLSQSNLSNSSQGRIEQKPIPLPAITNMPKHISKRPSRHAVTMTSHHVDTSRLIHSNGRMMQPRTKQLEPLTDYRFTDLIQKGLCQTVVNRIL